jgi:hypothetical protein
MATLKSDSGLRSTGIAVKAGWDISEFHGLQYVPLDVCVCVCMHVHFYYQ